MLIAVGVAANVLANVRGTCPTLIFRVEATQVSAKFAHLDDVPGQLWMKM
jgi:hypothetical protein